MPTSSRHGSSCLSWPGLSALWVHAAPHLAVSAFQLFSFPKCGAAFLLVDGPLYPWLLAAP